MRRSENEANGGNQFEKRRDERRKRKEMRFTDVGRHVSLSLNEREI